MSTISLFSVVFTQGHQRNSLHILFCLQFQKKDLLKIATKPIIDETNNELIDNHKSRSLFVIDGNFSFSGESSRLERSTKGNLA